jgi:hypothetical protein
MIHQTNKCVVILYCIARPKLWPIYVSVYGYAQRMGGWINMKHWSILHRYQIAECNKVKKNTNGE